MKLVSHFQERNRHMWDLVQSPITVSVSLHNATFLAVSLDKYLPPEEIHQLKLENVQGEITFLGCNVYSFSAWMIPPTVPVLSEPRLGFACWHRPTQESFLWIRSEIRLDQIQIW